MLLLVQCGSGPGLRLNHDEQVRIVDAAVGGQDGRGQMAVGNATAWWGQTLVTWQQASVEADLVHAAGASVGHDPDDIPDSASEVYTRNVTVISLETLLMDEDAVDLVHLDCQGQELPVLEQALKIGVLDKVRALHVATHSNIIEARILGLLCHAGWHLVTAHTTLASHLRFRYRSRLFLGGDGFQVWVNPGLVDIAKEFGIDLPISCEAAPHPWPPIRVT